MLASGVLVYLGADTCRCSEEITVPTYIRVSDYQVFEQQIRLIQIVLGPFNLFIRFLFIYFIGPLASLEAPLNSSLSVYLSDLPSICNTFLRIGSLRFSDFLHKFRLLFLEKFTFYPKWGKQAFVWPKITTSELFSKSFHKSSVTDFG